MARQVNITAFGATLPLVLSPTNDRPPTSNVSRGIRALASSIPELTVYRGTVVGVTGSSVWMSFSSAAKTADSVVAPPTRFIVGGISLPDQQTTLSIQPGNEGTVVVTCHTNADEVLFHTHDNDELNHQHFPKKISEGRTRREGPQSSSHTICPVFLDIDPSFHARWGGTGSDSQQRSTTAAVAASLLHQVSEMYEGQLSVTLALAGIYLRPDATNPVPTTGGDELERYGTWLVPGLSHTDAAASTPRGSGYPTAQDSCLNILLVDRNLGGTLGVANIGVAAPNYVGGLCETYLWEDAGTGDYRALNNAIISSRGRSRHISTTELVSIMAHEIGTFDLRT